MNLTDEEFIRRTIGPSHLPLKSLVPLTAIYSLFCVIGKKIILFPLIFDGFNIIECKKFDFKVYQIFKPYKVLREAVKKKNRIFYDIESISFSTYPPYLIMT